MGAVDVDGSEAHTDPKQLRKLRQQQLQQKFRKEMEAKRQQQQQYQDQTKSEDTEVPIGRGSSGGAAGVFMNYIISDFFVLSSGLKLK